MYDYYYTDIYNYDTEENQFFSVYTPKRNDYVYYYQADSTASYTANSALSGYTSNFKGYDVYSD